MNDAPFELSDRAQQVIENFRRSKGDMQNWRSEAMEDYEYYMNIQIPDKLKKELKKRGQAPLVINWVFPIIQHAVSIGANRMPRIMVLPKKDGTEDVASVFRDVIEYIWNVSEAQDHFISVFEDKYVKGVGYWYVYAEPDEMGDVEIYCERLEPFDVYPSPWTKRRDWRDADYVIVRRMISLDAAIRKFPKAKATLERFASLIDEKNYTLTGNYNPDKIELLDEVYDTQNKAVAIMEQYEPVDIKYYRVFDPVTGEYEDFRGDEIDNILNLEELQYTTFTRQHIRKTVVVGTEVIYDEIEDYHYIPIIPDYYLHTGNVKPVSLVRFMKGIQDEINKRRQILIAHAQVTTTPRVFYWQNSVVDEEEFESKWAVPGVVIKLRPGAAKPETSSPSPLPGELYKLETEAKYDIEYLTGVFSVQQGSPVGAPETFRGIATLIDQATQRQNLVMKRTESALRRLFLVLIDFVQAYWREEKILRIVGDADTKLIQLNAVDSETGEKINDVSKGKYDVVVVPGSTLPTNQQYEYELYKELYMLGVIDADELRKKAPIEDKEGVQMRLNIIKQLKDYISLLEQQIQDLSGKTKNLEAQLMASMRAREIEKFRTKLKEMENDVKTQKLLATQKILSDSQRAGGKQG